MAARSNASPTRVDALVTVEQHRATPPTPGTARSAHRRVPLEFTPTGPPCMRGRRGTRRHGEGTPAVGPGCARGGDRGVARGRRPATRGPTTSRSRRLPANSTRYCSSAATVTRSADGSGATPRAGAIADRVAALFVVVTAQGSRDASRAWSAIRRLAPTRRPRRARRRAAGSPRNARHRARRRDRGLHRAPGSPSCAQSWNLHCAASASTSANARLIPRRRPRARPRASPACRRGHRRRAAERLARRRRVAAALVGLAHRAGGLHVLRRRAVHQRRLADSGRADERDRAAPGCPRQLVDARARHRARDDHSTPVARHSTSATARRSVGDEVGLGEHDDGRRAALERRAPLAFEPAQLGPLSSDWVMNTCRRSPRRPARRAPRRPSGRRARTPSAGQHARPRRFVVVVDEHPVAGRDRAFRRAARTCRPR